MEIACRQKPIAEVWDVFWVRIIVFCFAILVEPHFASAISPRTPFGNVEQQGLAPVVFSVLLAQLPASRQQCAKGHPVFLSNIAYEGARGNIMLRSRFRARVFLKNLRGFLQTMAAKK